MKLWSYRWEDSQKSARGSTVVDCKIRVGNVKTGRSPGTIWDHYYTARSLHLRGGDWAQYKFHFCRVLEGGSGGTIYNKWKMAGSVKRWLIKRQEVMGRQQQGSLAHWWSAYWALIFVLMLPMNHSSSYMQHLQVSCKDVPFLKVNTGHGTPDYPLILRCLWERTMICCQIRMWTGVKNALECGNPSGARPFELRLLCIYNCFACQVIHLSASESPHSPVKAGSTNISAKSW